MYRQTWLIGPRNEGLGQELKTKPREKNSSLPPVPCANSHGGFNARTGIVTVMKLERGHHSTATFFTRLPFITNSFRTHNFELKLVLTNKVRAGTVQTINDLAWQRTESLDGELT